MSRKVLIARTQIERKLGIVKIQIVVGKYMEKGNENPYTFIFRLANTELLRGDI